MALHSAGPRMAQFRRKRLTPGRRLVCDIVWLAQRVPSAGILADLDLQELAAARKLTRPRIAWNVLLLKAYALVAKRRPELRQIYVRWPWGHVYEHPTNVCMMTFSREHQGEERLLFGRFESPEEKTLEELQTRYDEFRDAPVDSIKQFRHQIRFANYPGWIRRCAWWLMREIWVCKAASHMGTFGMSISSFKGVYGTSHVSPSTTTLGVDVIARGGQAKTLLTFDHRLLDGKPAVDILQELAHELRTTILQELRSLAEPEAAPTSVSLAS